MKILLIYRVDLAESNNAGVINKMKGQAEAFTSLGHDVDTMTHAGAALIFNSFQAPNSIKVIKAWQKYRYTQYTFYQNCWAKAQKSSYDLIYLRYPYTSPALITFLTNLKSKNTNLKIIVEFPTFPYASEFRGLSKVKYWIDQLYVNQLSTYVDRAVHFGIEEMIYKIPTISLTNGINADNHSLSRKTHKPEIVRLLGIGKWQKWHGIDRLLRGLAEYYQASPSKLVNIKLVGVGSENQGLLKLTKELGIMDHVEFVGNLEGTALDDICNVSDLGIGTLAIFRKGIALDSSLKHREYCARGLPFVHAGVDQDFDENFPFHKSISEDESAVDIMDLLGFYTYIQENHPDYKTQMRNYAIKQLTWQRRMDHVINNLFS